MILTIPFTTFSITNVMAQGPGPGWSNLREKCKEKQDITEACKVFQVIGQDKECLAQWNSLATSGIPRVDNAKEIACQFAANKGYSAYKCL